MSIYATRDNPEIYIAEHANIRKFSTRAAARAYLEAPYDLGELESEEGALVFEEASDYADCWKKLPYKPSVGDPEPSLFSYRQVLILNPGEHPGGKYYWLTPRPEVMTAGAEKMIQL